MKTPIFLGIVTAVSALLAWQPAATGNRLLGAIKKPQYYGGGVVVKEKTGVSHKHMELWKAKKNSCFKKGEWLWTTRHPKAKYTDVEYLKLCLKMPHGKRPTKQRLFVRSRFGYPGTRLKTKQKGPFLPAVMSHWQGTCNATIAAAIPTKGKKPMALHIMCSLKMVAPPGISGIAWAALPPKLRVRQAKVAGTITLRH